MIPYRMIALVLVLALLVTAVTPARAEAMEVGTILLIAGAAVAVLIIVVFLVVGNGKERLQRRAAASNDIWMSLAARTLKPACSIFARIAPATPFATASGLMMARVRCVISRSPRAVPRRGPRDRSRDEQPDADDQGHPVAWQADGVHQDDTHAHGRHDRPRYHEPASGPASRPAHVPITLATVAPMSAGLFTTVTPAACRALIFSAAVPLPPAMIAPA